MYSPSTEEGGILTGNLEAHTSQHVFKRIKKTNIFFYHKFFWGKLAKNLAKIHHRIFFHHDNETVFSSQAKRCYNFDEKSLLRFT